MIHRPTVSRPVEVVDIQGYWREKWRCAVRPYDRYQSPVNGALAPTHTDPDPSRQVMAKVFLGQAVGSELIAREPIVDGRIQPTLALLARLTGHRLIWNSKDKAARFEPLTPNPNPNPNPVAPRKAATVKEI
jgi:hypothetical protein